MSWADVAIFKKSIVETDPETLQDLATYSRRTLFVTVRSVRGSDFYAAAHAGLKPACVVVLENFADYEGERIVELGGNDYTVLRRYRDGDRLELTLEERIGEPEGQE